MAPIDEFDKKLEQMIHELALRILVPRWNEFDAVWESANKICDRYPLKQDRLTSKPVNSCKRSTDALVGARSLVA